MIFDSLKFRKARHQAFLNTDIMPVDCIDILQEVYGKQLDRMKPVTICAMVWEMMQTSIPDPDAEMINDAVQNFCNAY